MPGSPNPNKFTIVSNSNAYLDSYYSDGGSGIDLHSPVSMEVSIQRISISDYTVIENDFTLICDTGGLGSNININLNSLSTTCNNGKMLAIKKLADGDVYNVSINGVSIDGQNPYIMSKDYESIIIVYDKIYGEWYRIGNV